MRIRRITNESNRSRGALSHIRKIIWLALLVALTLAASVHADETARATIESVRSSLADIENVLKSDNLTDGDLARLREINDPLAARLQAVIADVTPRLDASRKRLAELKPKTKDAAAQTDSASDDLKDEQTKFDALDADLRSARALLLQTDDDANRIGAARRDLFARQTFARSSSALSPVLWSMMFREAPQDAAQIGGVLSDWMKGLTQRLSETQALSFVALILALVAISAPIRWLARRVIARDPGIASPTRLRRALAALWTIIVLAGIPLAMLGALSYALDVFDISDPRLQSGVDAILDGLRLIAIAYAFAKGLLAPKEPNWRMFSLGNRGAALLFRFLMFTATIWAAERLMEAIAETTASLNISIASRALGAVLIGLGGIGTLRRIVDPRLASQPTRDSWAPARTLAWVFIAILMGSALTGYIAFAAFLVNQTLFVFAVGGGLYLADTIVQESAEEFLKPDAAFGHGLMAILGLRRETIEQFVVIAQGFARVAALVTALVVAFAPLGLPSQDIVATMRAAYFGYTIGGVTISVSSLIAAAFAFVIAVGATRAAQGWLTNRYLPRTRIDPSVSNSINTITGYIGLIIALLIGGSRLGIDLQQFEIVAGALSVGIGFGLQGIVNNFVSGLILLWERGIKVGDWVVVGAEQGFVRKINARATEIETFDRATLIVPNLTLVTGSVKNWMHTDRMARIVISLNVDFDADPEAVRAVMIATAKGQEAVLTIPAPLVLFNEFADWALKFQLICYVDDALMAERVRSELNFDLIRRLREARLQIALPYPRPK
jgi:small-conductance mechanosensitive channel